MNPSVVLMVLCAAVARASILYCNSTGPKLHYKEHNKTIEVVVRRPQGEFPGAVRQMFEEPVGHRPELPEREELKTTHVLDMQSWLLYVCHRDPWEGHTYAVKIDCAHGGVIPGSEIKTRSYHFLLDQFRVGSDPEHGWVFDLENIGVNYNQTTRGIMDSRYTFIVPLGGTHEMRGCTTEPFAKQSSERGGRKHDEDEEEDEEDATRVGTVDGADCTGKCDPFGREYEEQEACGNTWPIAVAVLLSVIGLLVLITLCHRPKKQRVVVVDRVDSTKSSEATESPIVKAGTPPAESV